MNRQTPVIVLISLAALVGCSSDPQSGTSGGSTPVGEVATPSTANTPFEIPRYPIGETFELAGRVECRVDRVRYMPVRGQNQKLKMKLWQRNIGSEASDGCFPYNYVDTQGQKWDMMSCRSPQVVPRGTAGTYTSYIHVCTFPAGTQIAEVYFASSSKLGDDEAGTGERAVVTL